MSDTLTFDLLDGLARIIAAGGVATYRDDGSAYVSDETAVVFAAMPQTPDRCVVLSGYTVSDSLAVPLGEARVQARFRGLPNQPSDAWTLENGFYRLTQMLTDQFFGSIHLIQFYRRNSLQGPADDNQRFECSANYTADVDYPATVLRPAVGTY